MTGVEWGPSEYGGYEVEVGPFTMRVELGSDEGNCYWWCHWRDDKWETGVEDTLELAKAAAMATARELAAEALERLS